MTFARLPACLCVWDCLPSFAALPAELCITLPAVPAWGHGPLRRLFFGRHEAFRETVAVGLRRRLRPAAPADRIGVRP